MNTVMMIPVVAPRLYRQLHRVCRLHDVASRPAQASVLAWTAEKKDKACPPVLTLLSMPCSIGWPASVASERTSLAMMHQAETALASQTVRTYRQWYSHWRHRGVRVNDLLDMTWVWHQRARTD